LKVLSAAEHIGAPPYYHLLHRRWRRQNDTDTLEIARACLLCIEVGGIAPRVENENLFPEVEYYQPLSESFVFL